MLFGCYRRGDANDPDTYVAAVAAVLASYDDADLIREVTDPRTGINATEKFASFMPNAGELKIYCDGVARRKANLARLGALPKPDFTRAQLPKPGPKPGDLANAFIPATHPKYQELVEWSRDADDRLWRVGKSHNGREGIYVAHDIAHKVITGRKVEMNPVGAAAKKVEEDAA